MTFYYHTVFYKDRLKQWYTNFIYFRKLKCFKEYISIFIQLKVNDPSSITSDPVILTHLYADNQIQKED